MSSLRYFVIYKPYGVICQFSGNKGPTLSSLADFPKDVYPVGRLDADSEGLLLLTNDKALNFALLNPKNKHNRTYFAQLEGLIEKTALQKLEKGVEITVESKKYITKPAVAQLIEPPLLPQRFPPIRYRVNVADCWIALTLVEGKNRQVRKMTAAVGYPTLRLVRFCIEQLTIEGFKSGEVREFTQDFIIKKLRMR